VRKWLLSDASARYLRRILITSQDSAIIARLREAQLRIMEDGDVFYVEEHMLDLIEFAMESFEGEILHPTDLLTPMGFALFPRTVLGAHSPDQHDAFRYQAIAWHVLNDWAEAFFYNTTGTLRPDGKLRSIHWTTIPFDRSLSDAVAEAYPERTVTLRAGSRT